MTRTSILCALLLLPLLLGAYPSACNRSAGVWPNYDLRYRDNPSAPGVSTLRSASLEWTDAMDVDHIDLYLGWSNDWYDCVGTTCTLNVTRLQDHLARGLADWTHKDGWRQYNVNLVINVHQQYDVATIGPSAVRADVTKGFQKLYDAIYGVMKRDAYRDTPNDLWTDIGRATWLISIGNEVDLFMPRSSDWEAYRVFAQAADTYIKSKNTDGLPIATGVCMTYYGVAFNHVTRAKPLHTVGDVALLTYYPIVNCDVTPKPASCGSLSGVRVGEPNQATGDVLKMAEHLAGVNTLRPSNRPARLFLQEVGYPTGVGVPSPAPAEPPLGCPPSLGNNCTPSQLKTYQTTFVNRLANAVVAQPATVLHGLTWWSLTDYTESECNTTWRPSSADHFCYMGLLDAQGAPKPALEAFRQLTFRL